MGRDLREPAGHQHGRPGFQLRADPQLRAELDYCVPLGIPHSKFLAWSDTDRGYALGWQRHKAETCSGCGTRRDEWDQDPDAYVPDTHYCRGCAVLAEAGEQLPKDGDRSLPGFHPYLQRREIYDREHPINDTDS